MNELVQIGTVFVTQRNGGVSAYPVTDAAQLETRIMAAYRRRLETVAWSTGSNREKIGEVTKPDGDPWLWWFDQEAGKLTAPASPANEGKNEMQWEICTFDGGSDHLLPGRWIAQLNLARSMQEHGKTEAEAVSNLKARLAREWPKAPWYQSLPVVHCT